jgi:hypothetical protein
LSKRLKKQKQREEIADVGLECHSKNRPNLRRTKSLTMPLHM